MLVPVDLSKLSDVVKSDVVKKTEYNKLVTKVDNIDTTNFVEKLNMKKMDQIFKIKSIKQTKKYLMLVVWLKKQILIGRLLKYLMSVAYVTNAALNATDNDLIQTTKFDTEVKKFDDKIASNRSGILTYNNRLNQSRNRIYDLERYASYFRGKNYFDGNDGAQNTLVFQTMQKHFNLLNQDQIDKWISKGLSDKYLNTSGTIGDVVLSKPIKPMHVIFKGKGTLVQ